MNGAWFYGLATQRIGPVTVEDLQRLAQARQIQPTTLVWSEGMPQWVAAGTLAFIYPPGSFVMPPPADGGALNLLLPVGPQSGMAIAAGYCGLLGLLCGITAPLGIIFGILGLRDLKAHPEKRGMGRAITGIVLGALVTVGVGVVAIVSATRR